MSAEKEKELKGGKLTLKDAGLNGRLPQYFLEYPKYVKNTRELVLDKNKGFSDVPPGLQGHSGLVCLSMGHCGVERVSAGRLPPSLESLDLRANAVAELERGLVSQLPRLTTLNLPGNHLSTEALCAVATELAQAKTLSTLDLSSNWLTEVRAGAVGSVARRRRRPHPLPLHLVGRCHPSCSTRRRSLSSRSRSTRSRRCRRSAAARGCCG